MGASCDVAIVNVCRRLRRNRRFNCRIQVESGRRGPRRKHRRCGRPPRLSRSCGKDARGGGTNADRLSTGGAAATRPPCRGPRRCCPGHAGSEFSRRGQPAQTCGGWRVARNMTLPPGASTRRSSSRDTRHSTPDTAIRLAIMLLRFLSVDDYGRRLRWTIGRALIVIRNRRP